MSSIPKPPAATVCTWLKANLGKQCLGVLTGQDYRALKASVQIADLWGNCDDREPNAQAFRLVVLQMQPTARELAFHAIAHSLDWGHRFQLWAEAGLPPFERIRICTYSPEARRRLAELGASTKSGDGATSHE